MVGDFLQVVLVNVHLVGCTKPFSIKASYAADAHARPEAFESLISDVFCHLHAGQIL